MQGSSDVEVIKTSLAETNGHACSTCMSKTAQHGHGRRAHSPSIARAGGGLPGSAGDSHGGRPGCEGRPAAG